MNLLQLDPPLPVETPHGEGMAILVIDYGLQWNTVWVVVNKSTRQIKHFDANVVRLSVNYTFGFGA